MFLRPRRTEHGADLCNYDDGRVDIRQSILSWKRILIKYIQLYFIDLATTYLFRIGSTVLV